MHRKVGNFASFSLDIQKSLEKNIVDSFQSHCYKQTFPQLFSDSSKTKHFLLLNSESPSSEICASAALTPHDFVFGNRLIKGACLGSVCVNPSFRGQKISLKLLSWVIEHCKSENLDFICLFSADGRLYEKCGFRYGREEGLLEFKRSEKSKYLEAEKLQDVSEPFEVFFEETQKFDLGKLAELWRIFVRSIQNQLQTSVCPVVSFLEFSEILQQTSMKVATLSRRLNGAHQIEAAAFYEKGADFQHVWHGLISGSHIESPYLNENIRLLIRWILKSKDEMTIHIPSALMPGLEKSLKGMESEIVNITRMKNMMTLGLSSGYLSAQKFGFVAELPSLLST